MEKLYNDKGQVALAEELGYYGGGINKCQIKWLEVGTKFYISEYDGFEELITVNDSIFIEA